MVTKEANDQLYKQLLSIKYYLRISCLLNYEVIYIKSPNRKNILSKPD